MIVQNRCDHNQSVQLRKKRFTHIYPNEFHYAVFGPLCIWAIINRCFNDVIIKSALRNDMTVICIRNKFPVFLVKWCQNDYCKNDENTCTRVPVMRRILCTPIFRTRCTST